MKTNPTPPTNNTTPLTDNPAPMRHDTTPPRLREQIATLQLPFFGEHHQPLADEAAKKQWTHLDYLQRLVEGEVDRQNDRTVARRIAAARFPVIKTLESFRWDWPKKINRMQVQHLFQLGFLETHTNVIFLGLPGLGKTHLASALGYAACLKGHCVLFANAIDVVNKLSAAERQSALDLELKKYCRPSLLILDELGYLPIDKRGSSLLFQVITKRYERGSTIVTTNKAFKDWPSIFDNDSTITSAVLDRLLHRVEAVAVEGTSYRMKDKIQS